MCVCVMSSGVVIRFALAKGMFFPGWRSTNQRITSDTAHRWGSDCCFSLPPPPSSLFLCLCVSKHDDPDAVCTHLVYANVFTMPFHPVCRSVNRLSFSLLSLPPLPSLLLVSFSAICCTRIYLDSRSLPFSSLGLLFSPSYSTVYY